MSRVLWWLLYAAAGAVGGWVTRRVLGGWAFDRGFRRGLDARPDPRPPAPVARCLAVHPGFGTRCVYGVGFVDHPTMRGHPWHLDGDGMGWPAW